MVVIFQRIVTTVTQRRYALHREEIKIKVLCIEIFIRSSLCNSVASVVSELQGIKIMENDELTHDVISCAIEVHKILGPGLLESA